MPKQYRGGPGIRPFLTPRTSRVGSVQLAGSGPFAVALAAFNGAMHVPNLPEAAPSPAYWQTERRFATEAWVPVPLWAAIGVPTMPAKSSYPHTGPSERIISLGAALKRNAAAIRAARGG